MVHIANGKMTREEVRYLFLGVVPGVVKPGTKNIRDVAISPGESEDRVSSIDLSARYFSHAMNYVKFLYLSTTPFLILLKCRRDHFSDEMHPLNSAPSKHHPSINPSREAAAHKVQPLYSPFRL